MTDISLYPHQKDAVAKLKNGSILCGGVGTGKSRTALYYYWDRVSKRGSVPFPLYIITTARKRDTQDWINEAAPFHLIPIVDSWNNIRKYTDVRDAFFIFDEQRVIGYGAWTKAFLKITKANKWILLSATPGDTWMDYIPVFIANGFYRNKTDFLDQHVVFKRFSKFYQVDRYVGVGKLNRYRNDIVVKMEFQKKTVPHDETIWTPFDKDLIRTVMTRRWDIFKAEPIRDAGGLCYVLRRIVNEDWRRVVCLEELLDRHTKAIIFYNFDYELYLLRAMAEKRNLAYAEWNGHRHDPLPDEDRWVYLVQYTAGAEGWNCTTTDTVIFYSQNYSYKIMTQAAGRVDRLNTPFTDLYYYHLISRSGIDLAIRKAIQNKRNFNESIFAEGR